jgi:hypothetical protein
LEDGEFGFFNVSLGPCAITCPSTGLLDDIESVLWVRITVRVEPENAAQTLCKCSTSVCTAFLTDLVMEMFMCQKLGENLKGGASRGGIRDCAEGNSRVVDLVWEGEEGFCVAC